MTDPSEHFDVLIVGAGLSGIGAGYHLQQKCPGKSYVILEGRDCIGGTWDLFRYPGIRSDSDMFTLGYSFKPWTEAKAIADGARILNYVRETAADNGIDQKIRFHHRVKRASWSTPEARWTVEAERATDEGAAELVRFTCSFLFMCSGYYKYEEGYTPEFAGSADFAGRIVHPQKWPEDIDYAGKRVVVIGSGATAVTLVPEMAETASHVTMLQRSPTYVVARPAEDAFANKLRRKPDGKTRLSHDPLAQRAVRHVFLPALPAQARPRQAVDPRRRQEWRSVRTTTSAPISRRAIIPGNSGCALCRTATCSRRSGTSAPPLSPTRSTLSPRTASSLRTAANSKPTSS